jgi:pyruvate dehydrogenase complex dehydrogenase (E1) component
MDPLFRQVGIYSSKGQLYEPVDKGMLLYYREATDGQVLEEGITEAGSMSSFMAAGTAYASHGEPMIPFYIFYSMFGFQRTGDQIWAFGDARGRGFLMGATAGRTTLNGEGLQHQDGHSHLAATTVANVRAYDPAFAYEIATIVQDGIKCMYVDEEDVFYYITLQNENYQMPAKPKGADQGILKGLYLFEKAARKKKRHVQLFGSGTIMNAVLKARDMLSDYGVSADVWSATSYQLLRREALSCERWNRLHPTDTPRVPWVSSVTKGAKGPFIAASDYPLRGRRRVDRPRSSRRPAPGRRPRREGDGRRHRQARPGPGEEGTLRRLSPGTRWKDLVDHPVAGVPAGSSSFQRPIAAVTAEVTATSSAGASSISRPRRPALTWMVSKPSALSSIAIARRCFWPRGLMPPET